MNAQNGLEIISKPFLFLCAIFPLFVVRLYQKTPKFSTNALQFCVFM
ncbi:hypothetical protein HMPREF1580_01376 [Gardnerella vaginalis JCP8070]|nr:hypothetical protein HMPREF1580_01376 [Gardnerella vaginalis JCP8070]